MLYGMILTVHLFVCLVLIAVILLQAGRGGGLADTFGGGAAQSFFGTRGTVYLTRATTICAAVFMLTSLSLAVLSVQKGRSLMERYPVPKEAPVRGTSLDENVKEAPVRGTSLDENVKEAAPAASEAPPPAELEPKPAEEDAAPSS